MLEIFHAKVTSDSYYASLWHIAKNTPEIARVLQINPRCSEISGTYGQFGQSGMTDAKAESNAIKHIRKLVARHVKTNSWAQSTLESIIDLYKAEPGLIDYYPVLRAIDPSIKESVQTTFNRVAFEIETTNVRVSTLEHGIIKKMLEENDYQIVVLRINTSDLSDDVEDNRAKVEKMWIKYVLRQFENNRIVCNNIIFLVGVNDLYYTYSTFLGSYTISASELLAKLQKLWAMRYMPVVPMVSMPIPIPVPGSNHRDPIKA